MPEQRLTVGKVARASLRLNVAALEGGKAEFVVADDGAGIATRKLAAAAVKLGVLPADRARASDAELLPLVFESGVSTSAAVTELSGRGLGLAIVRETVERLGGSVSIESRPGLGTTFRLVVPLTLATYRGIQVRVGERAFVLPTLGVERVMDLDRPMVSAGADRAMINVAGVSVPLVALRDILELPAAPSGALTERRRVAVVLGVGERRVAFEVDAVEAEQELLVKPLGKCLVRVRNVLGATILATGTIAPILNARDLLKSAATSARRPASSAAGFGKEAAGRGAS
jgi:two-component system chemotaxis sensor kinase CheA